ncbi:hypothetical protein [Lysobacter gummosus]|uniref:hypothetical protein n=1 Tax=Lysobacter gummosus TaxID=262324 RepID=UPI0036365CA2
MGTWIRVHGHFAEIPRGRRHKSRPLGLVYAAAAMSLSRLAPFRHEGNRGNRREKRKTNARFEPPR